MCTPIFFCPFKASPFICCMKRIKALINLIKDNFNQKEEGTKALEIEALKNEKHKLENTLEELTIVEQELRDFNRRLN